MNKISTIQKKDSLSIGIEIYKFSKEIYPIHRHLTGNGVRQTLKAIKKKLPELKIHEVPSGTKCFDWKIPLEWNVKQAYIKDSKGKKIIDIKNNNLHVVQYSTFINKKISKKKLEKNLHFLKNQPNAIPYVTSYYKKNWGFCLTYNQFKKLKDKDYHVFIDSNHFKGSMTYGELIIKGKTSEEVFLSTYICHPSLANNEVSGPALLTYISKFIKSFKDRKYTYRIIFIPETIGSIYYLFKNKNILKKNVRLGVNVSCVGDNGPFSIIESRTSKSYADKIFQNAFLFLKKTKIYNYQLYRGSDERQYCHPKIDLPLVTFMRTRFGDYKEYHTSLDNLNFISSKGFGKSYEFLKNILITNEKNKTYSNNIFCEPFMTKYNLDNLIEDKTNNYQVTKNIRDIINYIDENSDLIDISNRVFLPPVILLKYLDFMVENNIIKVNEKKF